MSTRETTTLLSRDQLRNFPVPRPQPGEGKEGRGRVLIIGGSVAVPGAALLAATGVLRVGAGKVAVATCARNATPMGIALPEAFMLGLPEIEKAEST
jgi:ADP-dependent NAD(P)H-hydrate dehydratase